MTTTGFRIQRWAATESGTADWPDTCRRAATIRDVQWLWADLGGLQHAIQLPAKAPITGCIWGWTSSPGNRQWIRLRVDCPLGEAPVILGAVLSERGTAGELVDVGPAVAVPPFTSYHSRGTALELLRGKLVHYMHVADKSLTFVDVR